MSITVDSGRASLWGGPPHRLPANAGCDCPRVLLISSHFSLFPTVRAEDEAEKASYKDSAEMAARPSTQARNARQTGSLRWYQADDRYRKPWTLGRAPPLTFQCSWNWGVSYNLGRMLFSSTWKAVFKIEESCTFEF